MFIQRHATLFGDLKQNKCQCQTCFTRGNHLSQFVDTWANCSFTHETTYFMIWHSYLIHMFPSLFAESFLEYIFEVPRILFPPPLNFPVPFLSTKISICLLLCCYSCPTASCLAKAVHSRARLLRVSAMWASVLLFLPWACPCPWAESAHTTTQSLGVGDGNSHTSACAYLQNSYIVALIALIEKWHYCQWEFYSLHQAKRAMAV